jgi:hypothetical protein
MYFRSFDGEEENAGPQEPSPSVKEQIRRLKPMLTNLVDSAIEAQFLLSSISSTIEASSHHYF